MKQEFPKAFNDALEKVAKALFEAVREAYPGGAWKCARFHDTGTSPSSGSR
jgi:hypothetical protein